MKETNTKMKSANKKAANNYNADEKYTGESSQKNSGGQNSQNNQKRN